MYILDNIAQEGGRPRTVSSVKSACADGSMRRRIGRFVDGNPLLIGGNSEIQAEERLG
jgi:hypothetical protein